MGIGESRRKGCAKDYGWEGDGPIEKGDPKVALDFCLYDLLRTYVRN